VVPKASQAAGDKSGKGRRTIVRQVDVPRHSLREALTVAQALTDNFAGHDTPPHQLAMALNISPTSSAWRTLTGAAVAYGLTTGAYNSDKIGLQDLGRRVTAPTQEGDDLRARAEAALKPRVFAQFFAKYHRAKFPQDNIAKNVLQQEFAVPKERVDEVFTILKDNGAYVGFIHQTKTGPFVSTDDLSPSPVMLPEEDAPGTSLDETRPSEQRSADSAAATVDPKSPPSNGVRTFKVFISHGRDMNIVEQVKDVLDLYDIEYEVAVEEETTAIPVPQKILAAMRRCQAGVMIVSADDEDAVRSSTINNNVLIEIGAAFVLYDQKVVLLWDKRLKVPSNLQGLYRCEFEGGQLAFDAGTRLAKAIKRFRS
jgi:predicted nucleotide-binding protein